MADQWCIKRRALSVIDEKTFQHKIAALDSESDASGASVDLDFSVVDTSIFSSLTPPKRSLLSSLVCTEDDSGVEWEPSLASPIRPELSNVKKVQRARTRLLDCEPLTRDSTGVADPAGSTPLASTFTPPHKRLRALNLKDSPHTPRSLLKRPSLEASTMPARGRLFGGINTHPRELTGTPARDRPPGQRLKANVNPFTPNNNHSLRQCKQHAHGGSMPVDVAAPSSFNTPELSFDSGTSSFLMDEQTSLDWLGVPPEWGEKLPLKDISNSRYNEEFHEQCKLGDGEHGSVYKCVNKLDGCTYAVKKSKVPVAGSVYERSSLQEVYAHAVLGKHSHVVRYYSAWSEDGHMYIQNEYCNGGSLADIVADQRRKGIFFSEIELKQILRQVALGLQYIHAQCLAHMDVKPGNIFIHYNERLMQSPESGVEEEDSCDSEFTEQVTYKIGDLGHVTALLRPLVDEGDCRYLPNELLLDNYSHLPKADIFALGLTIFQAGGGGELPKNGDAWHALRRGELPLLSRYSPALNDLLKSMINPDPTLRPTAACVAHHPVLCPLSSMSRSQLYRQLNEERFKNKLLSRQLKEVQQRKEYAIEGAPSTVAMATVAVAGGTELPGITASNAVHSGSNGRLLLGRTLPRSVSLSAF